MPLPSQGMQQAIIQQGNAQRQSFQRAQGISTAASAPVPSFAQQQQQQARQAIAAAQARQQAAQLQQAARLRVAATAAARSRTTDSAVEQRVIAFHRQRAGQGSPASQFEYGSRLLKGDGLPADAAQGREWIAKAAAQNFEAAVKLLEEIKPAEAPPAPAPAQ